MKLSTALLTALLTLSAGSLATAGIFRSEDTNQTQSQTESDTQLLMDLSKTLQKQVKAFERRNTAANYALIQQTANRMLKIATRSPEAAEKLGLSIRDLAIIASTPTAIVQNEAGDMDGVQTSVNGAESALHPGGNQQGVH